ncbi:hypothetical protein MTR67_052187 [Solanum verrucosum]|uniref:Cohesin subunit SCC3/SA HEAT-repeats domain-containing protein n=1 Tax=Solanum verrucosum TaxID=315347 RepID=A0AAF0ZZQ8_SOLVR|nr:hypothetical protein MTR67_052187 [Solanum verrucosum]
MEILRSCVKTLKYCATESYGELQDFALNKLKGIGDELIIILKSAIKEVACDDEYSLLLNLIRLYALQLSRQISIESLLNDLAVISKNFRTIDDEVQVLSIQITWRSVPDLYSAISVVQGSQHSNHVAIGSRSVFCNISGESSFLEDD